MSDGFLNPYNFLPIPQRSLLPGSLADGRPVGHALYWLADPPDPDGEPAACAQNPDTPVALDDGRGWTGTIPIRIVCRTPLLLVDQSRARSAKLPGSQRQCQAGQDGDGTGRVLPVRTRPGQHGPVPDLPATAVKGMLRSAFEAITNSRLAAARGVDGVPVHYPRATQPGQLRNRPVAPDAESFHWCVANDRTAADRGGKRSLPPLVPDDGAPPLLPYYERRGSARRGGPRR